MGINELSESLNVLLDLPYDSLSIILDLYRNDIEEERASLDHKAYGDRVNPLLAVQKQLDELEQHAVIKRDAQIAQSIADAMLSDVQAITAAIDEEKQIADDYDFARRLAGSNNVPLSQQPDAFVAPEDYNTAFTDCTPTLAKLAGLYVSKDAGEALRPSTEQTEEAETPVQCVVCLQQKSYFQVVNAPCGHAYCRECIQELFTSSFTDDTLFPPRCCKQHIDPRGIEIFMTREILTRFDHKTIEFNTKDKTYCSNKTCGTFIMPDSIQDDMGVCANCGTQTCVFCKAQAHGNNQCEEDPALKAVLEVAETEGWRRCNQCKTMIELRTGCYHMTCTCGHQFCYLCGAHPWKNCRCAQWDDDRLTEQTNRVQVRQGRHGAAQHAEVREQLISRHNCTHENWRGTNGGNCDECGHFLPNYLYRCTRCHVEFCRRCRNNRAR